MNDKLFRKNFIWNTIGSLAFSFTSLIFMIISTRVNGIDIAGIFTYAFSVASLLWTIGSYSGKIFQVTETNENFTDSDYMYSRLFTCLLMNIISIVVCIILRFDIFKSIAIILLSVYRSIDAFSEALYSVMQRNNELYKAGKSMFFKTILLVTGFYLINLFTNNLNIAILSLIIISILVLFIYDIRVSKKYLKLQMFSIAKNNKLLKAGFYAFLYSFMTVFVINIPKYILDFFSSSDMQGIFGIIIMPASFMAMAALYIIHPLLNDITSKIKDNRYNDLLKTVKKILLIVFCLGISILIICNFIGIPVLEFIYGVELDEYKMSFLIIISGSIFYSVIVFLSSILIAMRLTKEQVIILIVTSILSIIVGYFLIKNYGITGASITYSLLMIMEAIIYLIVTFVNINKAINCVNK